MGLYFLSYDLRKARNYQPLYDELAKFNATRVLESVWCFERLNITSAGLRDYFARLIDGDDGLLVVECKGWAAQRPLANPPATWTP